MRAGIACVVVGRQVVRGIKAAIVRCAWASCCLLKMSGAQAVGTRPPAHRALHNACRRARTRGVPVGVAVRPVDRISPMVLVPCKRCKHIQCTFTGCSSAIVRQYCSAVRKRGVQGGGAKMCAAELHACQ